MQKTKKLFIIASCVFMLSCQKAEEAAPYLTMADCDSYCKKMTDCASTAIDMIAKRKGYTPEMGDAAQKLGSRRACLQACRSQLRPDLMFKYPKTFQFYQHFYRAQMNCMDQADCKAFTACKQMQLQKAIADFPMDPTDERRCNETCERIHACADQLVPRIFAEEYTEKPLDKQAEMVRHFGDRDRCLFSCRYTIIQNRIDRRKIASATDENLQNLEPFFQCLSQQDCGRFAWCVTSQTPADDLK